MLQLRRRRLWIALSVILLAAVFVVCLQPDFGPAVPAGFDKVEHLAAYVLLALWFTGLVARGRYWAVAAGLLALGLLIEVLQWRMNLGRVGRGTRHAGEHAGRRRRHRDCAARDRRLGPSARDHGWAGNERRAGRRMAPAGRSHAAGEPRGIRGAVAPACAGQAAATNARRPQPALDAALGPARHRQDDARAPRRSHLRCGVRGALGRDGGRQGRACGRRAGPVAAS